MPEREFSDEKLSPDDELEKLRKRRMQEMEKEFLSKQNSGGGVSVVDEFSFADFVGNNRYAVLDMWAEWCGPCRMVAPVIEELSYEFSGEVSFGKCNTDENPGIAQSFSISAIPTLLFFSGGNLAERLTGAYPKDAIERRVKAVFML